jgi:hypothetical protein
MRKDIFIVGARLLSIWLLIDAINPLFYVIATWMGYLAANPYTQFYSLVSVIVHIVSGLYLLLKTNELFDFLERRLSKMKNTEENNVAL